MDDANTYHPRHFRPLTFHDAVPGFREGSDTPRRYLERCLETIAVREPKVQAWVVLNVEAARAAADAATARYREGRPLSPIDGMPVGIKDLFETKDMPTQMGCEAYAGNFTGRDAPAVRALRNAGAVVLGKTVTTELGLSHPGPTTNPFDADRTPGGSSSGSAAAVGAGMVPAALGSQVGGSIIRPASYCANYAMKVTMGALNRGDRQSLSQSVLGIHAGSPEDMWLATHEIARQVGGDPGYPGLFGTDGIPVPSRPSRLVLMETEGWRNLDADTLQAFEQLLQELRDGGIRIVSGSDSSLVDAFERSIAEAKSVASDINSYEHRWSTLDLQERFPGKVSARMLARMSKGVSLGVDGYRLRLQQRQEARLRHAAIAPLGDAVISLSSTGPAPVWRGDLPGQPLAATPTGDFAFAAAASLLGAPAVSVPALAVRGLPVGIQLMGQPHQDQLLAGIACWMKASLQNLKGTR